MIKNKTKYVANGCITFIEALIYEHRADELAVFQKLTQLCQARVDRLVSLDAMRNQ